MEIKYKSRKLWKLWIIIEEEVILMFESLHYVAVPPGETIKEQLADRGWTQKRLAQEMGISEKHMSCLIRGRVLLSASMARRLEKALGIPAAFWSGLEADFRADLARVRLENECGICSVKTSHKEEVTLDMNTEAIAYFRKVSKKVGISYQALMSRCLTEYAESHGY